MLIEKENNIEINGREFTRFLGGFGEDKVIVTDKQLGELLNYNIGARQVRVQMGNNIKHFEEGVDYINLKDHSKENLKLLGYSIQAINKSKNIYIFSCEGFIKFLTIADPKKDYSDFVMKYFKIDTPLKLIQIKSEHSFEQKLKTLFKDICEFTPQYSCCNKYNVDFYSPKYNLVIEYDEPYHKYRKKEDRKRQNKIIKELKCSFIRVQRDFELEGLNEILKFIILKEVS